MGARHAASDRIVFLDADDAVSTNYVAAMAAALDTHAIVASRIDHSLDPSWMSSVGSGVQTQGLQNGLDFLPFGSGGTLGFRKSVFDELGGFSERATLCEDIDICWRAQLAGYSIAFVPDAVLYNVARSTVQQMYRQHRDYARAWPMLYREFRAAGMPRRSTKAAVSEWMTLARSVPRLRTRAELARWLRRAGRNVGRLEGSIRHRVWYP